MECFDRTANVHYPRHEEYVGLRPDMVGLCVRCGKVLDAHAHETAQNIQRADERRRSAEARAAKSELHYVPGVGWRRG